MFNVCPGCGLYRVDRQVHTERSVAICPECQLEFPFKLLPMFVVTGASGCGKSSVLLYLSGNTDAVVCLDSDILWREEFNKPEDDYAEYRNLWLRLVKNIAQSGRPVALFGSATPGQFDQCQERRYIGDINYLALTCDDEELERRLKSRPGWRGSGSEDVIFGMKCFNRWLVDNAAAHHMETIDTTKLTLAESAAATLAWMTARLPASVYFHKTP